MVSVVVPIRNEASYLQLFLDSLCAQDLLCCDCEILLIDGQSTDQTREIIKEYQALHSNIRLLDNPHKTVPYAMNIGIRESKGDVIIRLDAHSTFPSDYISVLVKKQKELTADNIGCACVADVLTKTPKTLAIREVLQHPFGVGNSSFRTGVKETRLVDTVPFGCFPKETFVKYGMYDTRLTRNQDIELNKRIIDGGGKVYIIPDVQCTYYCRETYGALAQNNFMNGKWNILTVYFTKQMRSLSLRHFVPLLFLLSFVIGCALSVAEVLSPWLALFPVMLYLMILLSVSVQLAVSRDLNVIRLFITFPILHLSYGLGSLCGLLSLPFQKRPL